MTINCFSFIWLGVGRSLSSIFYLFWISFHDSTALTVAEFYYIECYSSCYILIELCSQIEGHYNIL